MMQYIFKACNLHIDIWAIMIFQYNYFLHIYKKESNKSEAALISYYEGKI